jgi:hypothetical protein
MNSDRDLEGNHKGSPQDKQDSDKQGWDTLDQDKSGQDRTVLDKKVLGSQEQSKYSAGH